MKHPIRGVLIPTIVLAILGGGAVLFYFGVRNKVIFINDWFLDDSNIRGVDVSSYQGAVDFNRLAEQGIRFAYIKATEGSSYQDSRFADNWVNAANTNVLSGAYHFFSFDSAGKTQAENFVNTIGDDLSGRLIPAVDIELYGDWQKTLPKKDDVVRELSDFLATIEDTYATRPLIYARDDFYEMYLRDDFGGYPRWVRNVYYPTKLDNKDAWTIWQYNDRGLLDGYNGDEKYIDLDVIESEDGLEGIRY